MKEQLVAVKVTEKREDLLFMELTIEKTYFSFLKFKKIKEVTTHKVVSEYFKDVNIVLAPRNIIDCEYFQLNGTLISGDVLKVKLRVQGDL